MVCDGKDCDVKDCDGKDCDGKACEAKDFEVGPVSDGLEVVGDHAMTLPLGAIRKKGRASI